MEPTQKFSYSAPTQEESKYFNDKLEELVKETSIFLNAQPYYDEEGRTKTRIDIVKKTLKEDGTNTKETSNETN